MPNEIIVSILSIILQDKQEDSYRMTWIMTVDNREDPYRMTGKLIVDK